MKKILIAFLFILTAIPAAFSAEPTSISATSANGSSTTATDVFKTFSAYLIYDTSDKNGSGISGATVIDVNTGKSTKTGRGGKFSMECLFTKNYNRTVAKNNYRTVAKQLNLDDPEAYAENVLKTIPSTKSTEECSLVFSALNQTYPYPSTITKTKADENIYFVYRNYQKPSSSTRSQSGDSAATTRNNNSNIQPTGSRSSKPETIQLEGYVYYADTNNALSGVQLSPKGATNIDVLVHNNQNLATSTQDGHFTIKEFPKNYDLVAKYFNTDGDVIIKYEDIEKKPTNVIVRIFPIGEVLAENDAIEETYIVPTDSCADNEQKKEELHAKELKMVNTNRYSGNQQDEESRIQKCVPAKCVSNEYVLINPDTEDAACVSRTGMDCKDYIENAESATFNDKGTCTLQSCKDDYKVDKYTFGISQRCDVTGHDDYECDGRCEYQIGTACNGDTLKRITGDPNADKGEVTKFENNEIKECKIKSCRDKNVRVNEETGRCEKVGGIPCDPKIENASSGTQKILKDGTIVCEPICDGENYVVKFDNNNNKYSCELNKNRDGTECTKNELKSMNIAHATAGTVKEWDRATGAVTSCTITECDDGWLPNAAGDGCDEICTAEITQKLKDDGAFDVRVSDDGKTCVAKSCKCEYTLVDDKCVPWSESEYTTCKPKSEGATGGTPHCDGGKEVCYITTCDEPKYTLEGTAGTANAKCVSNVGKDCNDVVALPENATAGKQREIDGQMKCVATACKTEYDLRPDGSACIPKMVLSKEEYQDQIAELSDNAAAMHEKENSWENRLIGAAGIGLTGVGGMMVGSALSEQTADANAEATMRQYLETFRCDYGDGKLIHGGEVNVELPGGNDMIELYTEYATRAADLKARKEALGMRPGIESEIVIDKAETGLYEYSPDGITGGTYASIARALMDPEGEDAAMWAAQKEATANKLKAGAIVAGVGSVGSLAANIAVNHNNPNKVRELKQKYEKMKVAFDKLQQRNDTRQPARKCSDYTGASGNYDNCICHNDTTHWWFSTEDGCNECKNGKVVNSTNNGCECPAGTLPDATGECKSKDNTKCTLTGDDILRNTDGTCKCMEGAERPNSSECKCPHGQTEDGSACAPKPEEPTESSWNVSKGDKIAEVTLKSDEYFKSGYATLTDKGKLDLDDFKENAEKAAADAKLELKTADDYCVIIVGKTDHQGFMDTSYYFKQGKTTEERNKALSKDRADSVKNYIKDSFNTANFMTYGIAAADCPPTPIRNDKCRTVNVIMVAGSCTENKTNNTDWIKDVVQIGQAANDLKDLIKKQ